jgi:hypothetical protein
MKLSVQKFGIIIFVLIFASCGNNSGEVENLNSPSKRVKNQVMEGSWHAEWHDPSSDLSETFTLDLRQINQDVMGSAVFDDVRKTKSVVTGVIDGNQVLLLMKPDSEELHITSWKGTVLNNRLSGTWSLHGDPATGMSSSGPWNAEKGDMREF